MQQETSWSKWSTVLFVLIAITLALLAFATWPPPPKMESGQVGEPVLDATPAAVSLPAADADKPPDAPIRVAAEQASGTAPLDFAACIAELCDLGRRTAALAQQDEIDAAKVLDRQARELFANLLAAFPDAGDRSLAMLVELAGQVEVEPAGLGTIEAVQADAAQLDAAQADTIDHAHRIVLQMVLQADLGQRHKLAIGVGDRTRVDALTQATLDTMPIHLVTAEVGAAALAGRPYLRLAHEPSVLELVRLAGEQSFPRHIATKLLSTLWDNLQENGERSSAELSQLGLILLDGDVSQAIAACRQLLADPRYRPLVLSWLRERQDRQLAGEIAQWAANELPPRDALDVLRELTPLLSHSRGTFLGLGLRAPELLADAYREHLAADNQPDVRRELVMGIGLLPEPVGLQVAELALANDPSPDVRIQAMFAFTVHGSGEQAERAIGRLLDDPVIAGDAMHLGAIVLALANLEHGDPNRIARLGQRLQSMSLDAESRQRLAEMLARVLPGGGTGR